MASLLVAPSYSSSWELAPPPKLQSRAIPSTLIMNPAQTSGTLTSSLLDQLINEVEVVIDEEKRCPHSQLSSLVADQLQKTASKVSAVSPALWLGPIVASGGATVRDSNRSSDEVLTYDVVKVAVGAKANDRATLCVRTLFVEPKDPISRIYTLMLEMVQVACNALQTDTPLRDVHGKLRTYVMTRDPEYSQFLPQSFGFLIDPRNPQQRTKLIVADSSSVARPGEVYAISLIIQGVPKPAEFQCASKTLSVEITDSVWVGERGPATLLTTTVRRYADVSYFLDGGADAQATPSKSTEAHKSQGPVTRSSRRKATAQEQAEHERKRKVRQRQLRDFKLEELRQRFLGVGATEGQVGKTSRSLSEVSAYSSADMFPEGAKRTQVFVDPRNEAVILPIQGQKVPFHVSAIKNVSRNEEGKFTFLRINFFSPGVMLRDGGFALPEADSADWFYIRELTFKSAEGKSLNNSFRLLKDLIKAVKAKGNEEHAKKDLVSQAELVLIKGKRPTLPDLVVRPNITGKKTTGTLEGHANGLRFVSTKGEKLDLIYTNVKHAVFQPVQQELTVLLHFNLHNPIMVGNKRSSDVQFYMEAGIQSDDLGVRGRTQDLDEIQQEQRERRYRDKLNRDFKAFIESVQAVALDALEFDIPYRELGFFGVPNKSQVFLMPSVNCLVNLTEQPFFVVTLNEIEIAHLERVQFALKAFDLVLIFKDYSRPPIRISNVPTESLEAIKDWLNDIDLVYSESTNNYNWSNVMKEVTKDMHMFVQEGGWEFLQDESDEEEEPKEPEESDSSFEEEDVSAEESAESEESDFSEESEESSAEDASEGSEGMDWDELEEEARKQDTKKRLAPTTPAVKRRKQE